RMRLSRSFRALSRRRPRAWSRCARRGARRFRAKAPPLNGERESANEHHEPEGARSEPHPPKGPSTREGGDRRERDRNLKHRYRQREAMVTFEEPLRAF